MYPTNIDCDFYFTSASWHEVHDKIEVLEFEEFISNNLKISDYSNEVKQYQFLFIAVQPDNPNHDDWRKYYSKKRGILYNNLKLDFERFEKANQAEAYQMQAELYLKSIFEIPTLRGMKKVHFEAQELYEDVRKLFLQKGWLKFDMSGKKIEEFVR